MLKKLRELFLRTARRGSAYRVTRREADADGAWLYLRRGDHHSKIRVDSSDQRRVGDWTTD